MPLDATMPQCVATPDSRNQPRCGRIPGWGVVHTHPQAERWACANLNRAGYRTFLPLYTAKRRDPVTRSMTRLVELPLFTGYAFVAIAPTDPWVPIRYTPGVHSLLMSGGHPNIAARASIEALEASQELRRSIAPPGASWASGMPCSLAVGTPFTGHPAVIVSVEGKRAVVAMLLFGELRQVSVDLACLVARE